MTESDRGPRPRHQLYEKVLRGVEDFWYEVEIPIQQTEETAPPGEDGARAPRWEQAEDSTPKSVG